VVILSPLGEDHYQTSQVSLSVNATDQFGIDTAIAQVTYPNGSLSNFTLYQAQQSDDFSNNTIGTDWFTENISIGPSQTCIANINATYPGKAFTSLSGNGGPMTDTYCSLIAVKPLDGDFDINISFNITGESGSDNAIEFSIIERNSSATADEYISVALSNWTGLGRNYEIYMAGENFSDYIYREPTNDTYGKLRIVRSGDLFSFYIWNSSGSDWYLANSTALQICRPLYVTFDSESALPGWGSMNATWDDFGAAGNGALFTAFGDTLALGLYNVTFFVNDTLGSRNDSEKTNFTVIFEDQPPSKPIIYFPTIGAVLNGTQNISWLRVRDYENDSMRFNITLLNPDGSDNATIVSDYGDISSTYYGWDTTAFPDGIFSIRVTVYENETPEQLSNSYTLPGNFKIDNNAPSIEFVPPTETSGSLKSASDIKVNVTANDLTLNTIHIRLYNSSGALINESNSSTSPLYFDFTGLAPGLYYFNASALDALGHENRTETRNVTLVNITISNVSASPIPDGFGFNVTINANVSQAASVLVGVIPPGGNETNHTMVSTGGNGYSSNFSSWTNGTYSYTIYAGDGIGNWLASPQHNFTLFQNISIQVHTLKDFYQPNQEINITDPEFVNEDAPLITDASFNGSISAIPAKSRISSSHAMSVAAAEGVPISVHITDKWGVIRVNALIPTKDGSDSVSLALSSGTANDGIWEAVWQPHDLAGEHYIVIISAENSKHMNETNYVSVGDPPGVWIIPTGDYNPTGQWSDTFNARDGDTHTYAQDNSNPGNGWGAYIYFNTSQIVSDRVRIWADWDVQVSAVEIDVTGDGTNWTQVYNGTITNLQWFQANFPVMNVTGGRFRYEYNTGGWIYWLYEFQFYNVTTQVNVPVMSTQQASSVEQTTALLHAIVSSDGGDTCQARFLYGNSTSYTDSTPWVDNLFTGNSMTYRPYGLTDGQTYHFIAQINNSAGMSNGSDQFFTTGMSSPGWISAMGYDDPSGRWNNHLNSFDDDVATEANSFHAVNDPNGVWSAYLYLNRTPSILSRRVRFNAKATDVDMAEVDILVNGSYVNIFSNSFTDSVWTEATYNLSNVSGVRIRFRAVANNRGFEFRLAEFDFFNSPSTPPENQSKLENWGPTDASCFLFMKTQFWNGSDWLDDDVVVNDTAPRTLGPTDVLKLDAIWNPNGYATNNLSFGAGNYRIYAACLDNASNILMDIDGAFVNNTYEFRYDVVPPFVVIVSPINDTNYTLMSPIPIHVNATDPITPVVSVHANVSSAIGSEYVTLIYNSTSGYWETDYLNTNYVGVYTIQAFASDSAGNVNDTESVQVNVVDIYPPTVVLVAPADNFTNSSAQWMDVLFECNVTDNYDTQTISLYITNSSDQSFALNSTASVSGVYTHANFTLNLTAGNYTWNCLANDSSGNSAFAPANRTLHIVNPNCPIISSPGLFTQPLNYSGAPNSASPLADTACVKITSSDVIFDCAGFNITNDGTAGTTYGILLNGSLSNVTIMNCPSISGYTDGIFILNSSATITNSTSKNNTDGIQLANSSGVNISASNFTNNTGTGIVIDSGSSSNSFDSNRFCFNNVTDIVNSGSSNTGTQDRCGLWNGWNESGHAGCTYTCSEVWHDFFGNITGKKFLAPNNAQIFYSWIWNGQSGRVYAFNGGVSISWANITAIARNTTGGNSTDDFTTLDTLLNTSGTPDNLTALFGVDGSTPKETKAISIYGGSIQYVPLANSSSISTGSNAKTGIVWDASTDTNGHFDAIDNENIVFVNEINSTAANQYDIRIPSNLSTYKGPAGTVQFWVEMD
jgi:hypothetical protein